MRLRLRLSIVLIFGVLSLVTLGSSISSPAVTIMRTEATIDEYDANEIPTPQNVLTPFLENPDQGIQIIFSDVDGTLVHYVDNQQLTTDILQLPPSSTGMQGIISSKTLILCQQLRQQYQRKLVLISGMRTSTLWNRIPFLPRADAYCSEAGRIFFPVSDLEGYYGPVFVPHSYTGCHEADMQPFGLIEDIEWRTIMEQTCGCHGFVGMELLDSSQPPPLPLHERQGLLWEFARTLMAKGVVIDEKGYSTCFRINHKHQTNREAFDIVLQHIPRTLATSVNLGCIDVYPKESGKKNCCLFLAKKLCKSNDEFILATSALCLCDDDNDLEMALACQHAYVPSIGSESMAKAIKNYPRKFSLTQGMDGVRNETSATERALELVLERISMT